MTLRLHSATVALGTLLCLVQLSRAAEDGNAASETPSEPAKVSYYREVRPIFQEHCQGCHQPAKPSGNYVMTSVAELVKAGTSGQAAIVPGEPDESELFLQITSAGGERPVMPKEKEPLVAADVELIRRWIAEGATDDTPETARDLVDSAHPPVYRLPPVITSLDFSPDATLLAVSAYHEVVLQAADGSQLVARLVGISERIQSVRFSPDGALLAVAGGSPGRFGELQVWDVAQRKLKYAVTLTHDTLYGVSWSHDGSKIALGCGDNTVRALDAATARQVLYQGAHSDWVLDTVFSVDSSHLVSVSRDRSMKLTEVATERFVDNITSITPGALKGGLMTVDRLAGKDELLIGGADGAPKLYQMHRTKVRMIGDDFNLIRAYEAMPGRVFALRASADGARFIAGSSNDGCGEVRLYQTDAPAAAWKYACDSAVYALAYSRDGARLASGGFDGRVRLHDLSTGVVAAEFVPVPITTDEVASASAAVSP